MNSSRVLYKGKRVYIGLDVHRSFFVASCVCDGEVVKRCRLEAKAEAVVSLILNYFPNSDVRTCYEAGFSGFWLHRKLTAAGVRNIVVHPASIEVAANDRVKTDKRDSLKMATQLSAGRLRGIRVPSLEEEYRRLLARTREQFMGKRKRVQVQIRMRLHQFGLFPAGIERVLKLKDVEELLETLDGELKVVIESLYAEWLRLAEQIKELDRRMAEQSKNDPLYALYLSVPGIGPLTARVLVDELADMSQFANIRALYSFTGLTPGEYSSGERVYRGNISRQGNSRLRHLLVEAAWKAVRVDPLMRAFYMRIASRGGKKRAIVACARKLAGKARAVVREGTSYKPRYKKAA